MYLEICLSLRSKAAHVIYLESAGRPRKPGSAQSLLEGECYSVCMKHVDSSDERKELTTLFQEVPVHLRYFDASVQVSFLLFLFLPSQAALPPSNRLRPLKYNYRFYYSPNFNTSASHFSGASDRAPRKESKSGVKSEGYRIRSIRCLFFFRDGANGKCKVESDADVSGVLGSGPSIEEVDFGPYLVGRER